jgi:hypothetical protein
MTIDELKQVVAKIQLGDSRQVDRLVLEYWWELIGDLHFADSLQAVNFHRLEQPGVWLEPGHVKAGARRARDIRERADRRALPPAVPFPPITLDRAEFERQTNAAIEARRKSTPNNHDPISAEDY